MTDNRANEPTAEQILVDEWIRQADRAKSMTGMDAIWFPDAEETLAVLRANGLLSEGAPSEEQARAIRKLDNVQAILAGAQASVTDAVRELSLTSAALTAAGVAPQEPSAVTDINGHSWMTWEESGKNGTYCRSCGGWAGKVGNRQCSSAPELPSSGVDVETLANLIHSTSVAHFGGLDPRVAPIIARAVAGWLKGQER